MSNSNRKITYRKVALGINGTGKTTYSEKFVNIALESGRRALVVTAHENEWLHLPEIEGMKPLKLMTAKEKKQVVEQITNFDGAARILISNTNEIQLLNYFYNGLLVFDDCRNYTSTRLDSTVTDFLINSRQKMVDIIANAHGFGQMPPAFFSFITHLVLFKVNDSPALRKNELYNWRDIIKLQQHINREFRKNEHYKIIIKM